MADASPSSAKDLEIVEMKEEEEDNDQHELSDAENAAPSDSQEHAESKTAEPNGSTRNDGEKGSMSPKGDGKSESTNTASLSERAIRSRVFVGHLDTDQCSRVDVKRLFEQCGPVKAVSLQQGYGFVQYEKTSSALKALDEMHGKRYLGMNLVVDKPLMWKKLDGDEPITTKFTNTKKPFYVPSRDSDYRRKRFRGGGHHAEEDHWGAPPVPSRYRDPEYERYLEMRYMEEMLADRYSDTYYDDRYYGQRYSRPPPPPSDYGSDWYDPHVPGPSRSYGRPRDDPYDRMPFERERRQYSSRYGYH